MRTKKEELYIVVFMEDGDINPVTREECFHILNRQLGESDTPLSQQLRVFKIAEEVEVDVKLVPLLNYEEE